MLYEVITSPVATEHGCIDKGEVSDKQAQGTEQEYEAWKEMRQQFRAGGKPYGSHAPEERVNEEAHHDA